MKFEMSFTDGSKYDKRLIDLISGFDLTATLYIPTTCDLENADILDAYNRGFRIGCHSHSHSKKYLDLKGERFRNDILLNKEFLEDIIHEDITIFCPPYGLFNDRLIRSLKSYGFTSMRTNTLGCVTDLNTFKQDCTINIYKGFSKRAKELYKACKITGYFHLIGRSMDIERDWLWEELEDFLRFVDADLLNN